MDTRVLTARRSEVGGVTVRRALPQRSLRTVGPWCFVDHMGPEIVTPTQGLDVGPHPHIGLHTLTWLFEGAVTHTDSLGSEQLIRPGQVNLMTAGHGIVHAEQADRVRSETLHGIQLWLAQPDSTRDGASAFAHHDDLPRVEQGPALGTVFLGEFAGVEASVSIETAGVGVDLQHRAGTSRWPLRADFEYAVYCADGSALVDSTPVGEGEMVAWSPGATQMQITTSDSARLVILGGLPWNEPLFMWWNFVARSAAEVSLAIDAWSAWGEHERFGTFSSSLPAIPAPPLP